MNLDVIVFGDLDMMYYMFNAVAEMFQSGNLNGALALLFMCSVLIVMFQTVYTGKFALHTLLPAFILVAMGVSTTSDVTLISAVDNGRVKTVSNVPLFLAAPFSIVTVIGERISTLFETNASVPGQFEAGYLDPLASIVMLREIDLGVLDHSTTLSQAAPIKSLRNYLEICFAGQTVDPLEGGTIPYKSLLSEEDAFSLLRVDNPNLSFTYYDGSDPAGIIYSCPAGWSRLETDIGDPNSAVRSAIDKYIAAKIATKRQGSYRTPPMTMTEVITNYKQAIGNSSLDVENITRNLLVRDALRDAHIGDGNGGEVDTYQLLRATIVSSAMQQSDIQMASEKSFFDAYAAPLTAFIEIFVVGSAPLAMLFIALSPKGIAMVVKYGEALLWITMWRPVMSMINLFIYTKLSQVTDNLHGQMTSGVSSLNGIADGVFTPASHWLAVGGMLAGATPILAAMLVYGGVHGALSLASRINGRDTFDEKALAPDAVKVSALQNIETRHSTNFGTGATNVGDGWRVGALDSINSSQNLVRSSQISAYNQLTAGASAGSVWEDMKTRTDNRQITSSLNRVLGVGDTDNFGIAKGINGAHNLTEAQQATVTTFASTAAAQAMAQAALHGDQNNLPKIQQNFRTIFSGMLSKLPIGSTLQGSGVNTDQFVNGVTNNLTTSGALSSSASSQEALNKAKTLSTARTQAYKDSYGEKLDHLIGQMAMEGRTLSAGEGVLRENQSGLSGDIGQVAHTYLNMNPESFDAVHKALIGSAPESLQAKIKEMAAGRGGGPATTIKAATGNQKVREVLAAMSLLGDPKAVNDALRGASAPQIAGAPSATDAVTLPAPPEPQDAALAKAAEMSPSGPGFNHKDLKSKVHTATRNQLQVGVMSIEQFDTAWSNRVPSDPKGAGERAFQIISGQYKKHNLPIPKEVTEAYNLSQQDGFGSGLAAKNLVNAAGVLTTLENNHPTSTMSERAFKGLTDSGQDLWNSDSFVKGAILAPLAASAAAGVAVSYAKARGVAGGSPSASPAPGSVARSPYTGASPASPANMGATGGLARFLASKPGGWTIIGIAGGAAFSVLNEQTARIDQFAESLREEARARHAEAESEKNR
jgi:hypothetical protein